MQNIFELMAQRQQDSQATVVAELDKLISNRPAEEQLSIVKQNYITRVTELESNVRALESHLHWKTSARPQLINITNFVAGLSIGAVGVYVALTSTVLNHYVFF